MAAGTTRAARTTARRDGSSTPDRASVRSVTCEFWAPNRGLLITAGNGSTIPPGLWAYNGERWHELSTVCGATDGRIAWAGPDEFWTISDGRPVRPPIRPGKSRHRWKTTRSATSRTVRSSAPTRRPPSRRAPTSRCTPPPASARDCWFGGDPLPEGQLGAFHLHWDGSTLNRPNQAGRATPSRTCALRRQAVRERSAPPLDRAEEARSPNRDPNRPSCTSSTRPASQPRSEAASACRRTRLESSPQALDFLHLGAGRTRCGLPRALPRNPAGAAPRPADDGPAQLRAGQRGAAPPGPEAEPDGRPRSPRTPSTRSPPSPVAARCRPGLPERRLEPRSPTAAPAIARIAADGTDRRRADAPAPHRRRSRHRRGRGEGRSPARRPTTAG